MRGEALVWCYTGPGDWKFMLSNVPDDRDYGCLRGLEAGAWCCMVCVVLHRINGVSPHSVNGSMEDVQMIHVCRYSSRGWNAGRPIPARLCCVMLCWAEYQLRL